MLIMSGAAYTEHCVSDNGRLSAYFFGSVSHRGCFDTFLTLMTVRRAEAVTRQRVATLNSIVYFGGGEE
jgi:hypothetical protein